MLLKAFLNEQVLYCGPRLVYIPCCHEITSSETETSQLCFVKTQNITYSNKNTHKQWHTSGVSPLSPLLMSRLLFVMLMMLNMLDEVINTVQLSSLIMHNIGK